MCIGMKGGRVFVGRGEWELFVCCEVIGELCMVFLKSLNYHNLLLI